MSRSSIIGSTIAHVIAIWLIFFVVPPAKLRAMPQAIQVALVNLPEGALSVPARGEPQIAPAPKPKSEEPKARKPEPAPPEKNAVRPPDTRQPLPNRPTPGVASGVETESAPLGVPGLSGQVGVDVADFEFTYYLIAIRNRIARNWGAPTGIVTQGDRVRCVVSFRIDRLGRLSDIRLSEPSGVAFFDQSALRAVSVSNPLPPLPAGYSEPSLGVHFGFQYADN